tara:strand:+ start:2474 stop:2803 length:330 start_codon:yes stop_codon:yes gene_type:complete
MGDTPREYWETVKGIAEEAMAEHPDDEDTQNEYAWESVDGSYWIIYYHANEVVLDASSNEPDGDEVRSMSDPSADWRQMRMIAAFQAMSQDVTEALQELREEAELVCSE